jgi:hypothetical protein
MIYVCDCCRFQRHQEAWRCLSLYMCVCVTAFNAIRKRNSSASDVAACTHTEIIEADCNNSFIHYYDGYYHDYDYDYDYDYAYDYYYDYDYDDYDYDDDADDDDNNYNDEDCYDCDYHMMMMIMTIMIDHYHSHDDYDDYD